MAPWNATVSGKIGLDYRPATNPHGVEADGSMR
jgi:hypothetical protein